MPTIRLKEYAVRDANTAARLRPGNYCLESLAQREADKLIKKGKAAVVVPVEK